MRVVINEAQINRNRKISHILFFVSLAGMGVGFFYTWTQPAASSTSQISCLILPVLLLMTLTSVRMANQWIREPRPVTVLADALKGLGQKYTLFHHVLPTPHVLIGPEGVFTLTVVWQERSYRIEGKKWRGDEGVIRKLNGYLRQDLIGNPFQEALYQAQQVQKLVDKVEPGSKVEVQPLIVLINPKASFEAEDPVIPVLYADSKRKPALRLYLRDLKKSESQTLSLEALDKIDRMYGLMTREEIAEMVGESVDDTPDEDEISYDDEPEPDADETDEAEVGTVFVVQSGQLYYIGATTGLLDDALSALEPGAPQDGLELIHSFDTADPHATEAFLHRKFARKRQKEHWFGLSKKDVSWLKSRRGELL